MSATGAAGDPSSSGTAVGGPAKYPRVSNVVTVHRQMSFNSDVFAAG